jgi:hypothetical protein
MLPAINAYHAHTGYCGWIIADKRIDQLIPDYSWREPLTSIPIAQAHRVVSLNVWDAVEKFGKDLHPTRMFFKYLGLDDPGDGVRPEIAVDENAPVYDYVIAPFANDPARAMPFSALNDILVSLKKEKSRISFVCGGSADEYNRFQYKVHGALGNMIDFFGGSPLPYVAGLMRSARKAVITVDSMANRLAHAAGIKNHILLCSDVVPEVWATHPSARVLYGPPDSWTIDKILELIPA